MNEASNTTVVMVPFTVFTQPGNDVPVLVTAVPVQTALIVCPLYVPPFE